MAAGQTGTTMTWGPRPRPTQSHDTTGASLMLASAAGILGSTGGTVTSDHAASATMAPNTKS